MSKPKHKKPKSPSSGSKKRSYPKWLYDQRLKLMIIFGSAFLVYANALMNGFALDDAIVITDNMFTKKGFSGVVDHFTNELFFGFFKDESKATLVSGGRYRPLSVAMFAMEYGLFGENPFIGHLINILLYGLTGIVLFLVLSNLFRNRGETYAILLPFVATILYITHPIHTEVVANIKGRDEILALLGSLGALYYILRGFGEKNSKQIIIATGIFFLALLSKENAITFLAVVPIALIYFKKAKVLEAIKYTLPLFGASVIFLIIRSAIVPLSLGDAPRELMNNPFLKIEGNQYVDFTLGEQLATVLYSWGYYLKLLFFPHPLSHDYYPRQIDLMTFGDWQVMLSVIVFGIIGFIALRSLKTKHLLGFCAIYFLATFSIVSNLLFPIGTGMSERFMYMASVGFSLACGYGIIEGAKWLKSKGKLNASIHN
ncbi:MAG: hypothetical protein HKP42_00535, partial [Maribacter sp.]|nr:hypothetical protein [Maribacter sp.]